MFWTSSISQTYSGLVLLISQWNFLFLSLLHIVLHFKGKECNIIGTWMKWILWILSSRNKKKSLSHSGQSLIMPGQTWLCLLSLITDVEKLQNQETPCQGTISCQHIVVTWCPNSSASHWLWSVNMSQNPEKIVSKGTLSLQNWRRFAGYYN